MSYKFNKQAVLKQAETHNSFYLYDESIIMENTGRLKNDFENVEFLYSMKTNPHPMVVKTILSQGFGVDAASLAEAVIGHENGVSKDMIQYSAPGKTAQEIESALGISTLIADSLNEVILINEAAKKAGIVAEIGVRINPDFTFYSDKGIPAKFGVDEEAAYEAVPFWKSLENIRVVGIHVHSRSQELDAKVLAKYYENMFRLAENMQDKLGYALKFINMGSGIGIPFSVNDDPVDTGYLGGKMAELTDQFKARLPEARIFIETGRYCSGKSGVYATKVLDKKVSRGKTFVILDNTLNGFIRPSMIQFVMSFSKEEYPAANEPLFTSKDAFEFIALTDETETEEVSLVGNLCTGQDIAAKDIVLPKLKVGDVIVMTNAGAYAASITPMQFSTHVPPAQLFLTVDGKVVE